MKKDEFGDRMKAYEKVYTQAHIPSDQYIVARIDGKGFSKLTKKLNKPFDRDFTLAMDHTTKFLMEHTHAKVAYVQSDEINLFFDKQYEKGEHWFGGKTSKMNSVLASMTTFAFAQKRGTETPAFFDCRSWAVPSVEEVANTLLWRYQDCERNSIASAYRWDLKKKKMPNRRVMLEELGLAGKSWYYNTNRDRSGGLFVKTERTFVTDEGDAYTRRQVEDMENDGRGDYHTFLAMFDRSFNSALEI